MATTVKAEAAHRDQYVHDAWAALIQEALEPVLVISLVTYWIWQVWLSASVSPARVSQAVTITLYMACLFTLCWHTLKRRPHASAAIWIGGLYLGALIGALLYRSSWPYLVMPLTNLVCSLLLGRTMGAGGAVLSLLLLFMGRSYGVPLTNAEVLGIAGLSITAVALGLTLHAAMQTVVDWSLTSYRQAIKEMVEARERRAELVKVVKELDNAYYRLARLNSSLIEAWQRATDAEQRRTQLVTTISHELRTPLNLILGFSEMIATSPESYGGVPLPPAYRSDFNAVYRTSLHLLQLLDDVLDLAKADVGKLSLKIEEADFRGLLEECVVMLDEYVQAKGLKVLLALQPDLPRVPMDRLRIRQVLLNLMTNAARFTDSGHIKLEAGCRDEELVVSVADTGQGISPGKLKTIFEEFDLESTPDEQWHAGTGLGLPISRKLVELHGGRIWIESQPGRGTTIYLTLPLSAQSARSARLLPGEPLPARLTSKPLLLTVTQDGALVQDLQKRLDNAEVVAVDSWEEARRKGVDYRARLILADSEGGISFHTCETPVLRLPLPSSTWYAEAIGAQAILTKPLFREVLLQSLATFAPGARTILVVDDDSRFAQVLIRMLAGQGERYRVLTAYTAGEALSLVNSEKIDAFILDQLLPDMRGVELCKRVRESPGHLETPIIFVTGCDIDTMVDPKPGQAIFALPGGWRRGQILSFVQLMFEGLGATNGMDRTGAAPAGR